ncbi:MULTISPECIES: hypothetical protein [Gordonia]|jgi:hypothetical protein|uniref:Uncharacterized protein n=1 Tax=Gordonia malaquae NBRC 108250 TaxID=1223542 RepID=M3UST5_GORML|nr:MULTISPECIES: hypothetical protein [Gordonia]QRY64168.1 hypothetical protein JVX90_08320 [Gordonia sp. PDNC005]GAC78332.1 hypothetical protein GM1_003_00690 [Gordonia malaquae NBRC 108250]SED31697.1 hypothetical protein SAMN04488550_2315 [Gordonia malaquae]
MRNNRTSPTIGSTIRVYGRRINRAMNMSHADRTNLQLSNSPVSVLGPTQRRR